MPIAIYFLFASFGDDPPVEWVDPSTHHRVVRLSVEPRSSNLYFHQNPFPEEGDKMVFSSSDCFAVVDLKTRKVDRIADRFVRGAVVGRKSRRLYFRRGDTVFATHLDTHETVEVAKTPAEWGHGSGLSVNADETLLAGTYTETEGKASGILSKGQRLEAIFQAHRPTLIYTISIRTGDPKVILRGRDWFNHIQFSPVDPGLILFCHEGPWHKLDRIWTIRSDGTGLRLIHERTMDMEIVGHEFWSPDGKIVWYDQQTPKGKEFWLGGTVLSSGEKLRYKIERDQWSVHYNVSRDGALFAGDGGSPRMAGKASDGQWINLFRIKDGGLLPERLVNLSTHDYQLEPNVMFTPDGNWIVFRSNMHKSNHVYMVEVAPAK